MAHDLFVHHFGSRTFAGAGINAEKLRGENGRKFAEMWEAAAGVGQAVALIDEESRPWKLVLAACPGDAEAMAQCESSR